MLVSHPCKFLYVKTYKTAGTSVEMYFEPFCVAPDAFRLEEKKAEQVSKWGIVGSRGGPKATWYNHMPASELRARVGPDIWERYAKFCVVRNPFDRLLSVFWYTRQPEERAAMAQAPFAKVRAAFGLWLEAYDVGFERIIYLIDDQPALDFYIRYEALEADMATACAFLDVPWQPKRLSHRKSGYRARGEPSAAYFDAAGARRVAERYAWEIATFGYDSP